MLSERDHATLRRRLEGERQRILGHIAELDAMLRLEDREIGSGEDDADIAARTIAYDGLLTLRESEQQTLDEVEEALRSMDQGTYGVCESCGKEIDLARLEARPYARRCVSCQEREGR